MSGLVNSVKKVFKKATNFVKKYWKPILAAVAIYFTAGVALSYFGSTAGFASSLPGFGTGGLFSKAAVWMGFNGTAGSGLFNTAVAAGKIAPAIATTANTTGVLAADTGAIGAGGSSGGLFVNPVTGEAGAKASASMLAGGGGAAAGGGGGALVAQQATQSATESALVKALETQTKLSMVKMGIDTVSGLLAPDPYEEARKMHDLQYASSFGVDRQGNDTFGWGKSDSAAGWANMNKRQSGFGSNVGYGMSSDQSQFREAQFVPTQHEQNNPYGQMKPQQPPGQPAFVQPSMNRRA